MKRRIIVIIMLSLLGYSVGLAQSKLNAAQAKEMTDRHNYWRASLGIPPLTWSDEVAQYAQAWANELAASSCKLNHRRNGKYGENLFWASGMKITPAFVTDDWASEREHFDHKTQTCANGEVCGHYTQQIWEETTKIGCGMAKCSNGAEIWVCNYDPAGNYVGEKVYTPNRNNGSTNLPNANNNTNSNNLLNINDQTTNDQEETVETEFFDILSLQTNQCLNVKESMDDEGSPVILWQQESESNSKWNVEQVANNTYKITVMHSGLCLSVDVGKLVTTSFENRKEQLWELQETDGGYAIKSKANSRYLAVRAGRIVWVNAMQGKATTWDIRF